MANVLHSGEQMEGKNVTKNEQITFRIMCSELWILTKKGR